MRQYHEGLRAYGWKILTADKTFIVDVFTISYLQSKSTVLAYPGLVKALEFMGGTQLTLEQIEAYRQGKDFFILKIYN